MKLIKNLYNILKLLSTSDINIDDDELSIDIKSRSLTLNADSTYSFMSGESGCYFGELDDTSNLKNLSLYKADLYLVTTNQINILDAINAKFIKTSKFIDSTNEKDVEKLNILVSNVNNLINNIMCIIDIKLRFLYDLVSLDNFKMHYHLYDDDIKEIFKTLKKECDLDLLSNENYKLECGDITLDFKDNWYKLDDDTHTNLDSRYKMLLLCLNSENHT